MRKVVISGRKQKMKCRDIDKFRLWDNQEQCYQQQDADHCWINYKGEALCQFFVEDGYCGHTEHVEDFVIERCTGIKDRNGKLIYEGDIILKNIFKGIVIWSDDLAMYRIDRMSPLGQYSSSSLEIIGNIRENPELI